MVSTARRTKTGSPLGESLDHWLDALNLSFLFLGAVYALEIPPDRGVIVMSLAPLGYTMTFWEQRQTGKIQMAALGNVEGIFLTAAFYAACAILGPRTVIDTELLFGQTSIDFFYFAAVASVFVTSLLPLLRVNKGRSSGLIVLPAFLMPVLWYFWAGVSWQLVAWILMLLNPAIAGRMLIGHVSKKNERVDARLISLIAFVSIVCATIQPAEQLQNWAAILILIYTLALVVWDFVRTVRNFSNHLKPGEVLALVFRR